MCAKTGCRGSLLITTCAVPPGCIAYPVFALPVCFVFASFSRIGTT